MRRRPRGQQSPSTVCSFRWIRGTVLLAILAATSTQAIRRSVSYPASAFLKRRISLPKPLLADGRSDVLVRGGSSSSSGGGGNYDPYESNNPAPVYNTGVPPPQQPPPQQQYNEYGEYGENYFEPPDDDTDPFHETVQDRVDHWRANLQENAAKLQESPRDEKGRMKLMMSVGKGSRAMIFFFLMWRDVSLYETASQLKFASKVLTVPLIILFIGNLAGAYVSLTSPSHASKKRLKAILNLDKLVEVLLIFWSILRLTIMPAKYTPREIYIGNIFHSIFFLLQSQTFTRLSWDENAAQPMSSFGQQQRQQQQRSPLVQPTSQFDSSTREREDWEAYQARQRLTQRQRF